MLLNLSCHLITRFFVLLLLVLAVSSSPAHARERTVKVGVFENAPIVYQDESGGYSGLSIDILKYVAAKEDWKLEYVAGTMPECFERLERGEIDIQVYIAYSDERAKKIDFSKETLLGNWGVIYTWPGSGIENILDLEGRRVALMEQDIHAQAFMKMIDSFGIHLEIIPIDDHRQGFRLVSEKKVDAVVVNRIFGLSNAKQFHVEHTDIIFNPIEIRYAAPKGMNSDLLAAIDKHLKELKANKDSIYYQSYNKAFGLTEPLNAMSKWIYWGFLCLSVLIGCLVLINSILNRRVHKKTAELRREIGERKQAEKAWRESDTLLRTLIKAIPDLVWLKDIQGRYLFCNSRFERLYGAQEKDIIGKTDYDFVDKKLADFFRLHDQAAMAAGRPSVNEEELIFAADGHREILETIKTPMIGSDGQLIGVLGIGRDITERKRSEEERTAMEERLRQAQKMEAIGTLAGGIAHDFNNILAIIFGFTDMARANAPSGTQLEEDLEQISIAANRAKELVKQILAFSRQSATERIPLQIQPLIKEGLKMIRSSIPSTISMTEDIDPKSGSILADPSQVNQILMNLCTNAYHAMEERGGVLSVTLKPVLIGSDEQEMPAHTTPGEYLELTVSDTGCGIGPDILDKIFDPYFTTKGIGKGTGMGLAIIHGILADYGGKITVESQLGQGTNFHVFFPVVADETAPEINEAEDVLTGSERILFVDDEELLAEMAKKMLETLGYRVTVCNDSGEALAIFKNTPDAFDLVITDQTMPGLTGSELSMSLMRIRPDIPIILCTGYSNLIDEDSAKALGIKEFALKPLLKGTIATLIRKVLDEAKETKGQGVV
ncbi:MAG: transporter substrate-binding domain-containing protein [Desulfocapsaceae bacterium]|nr:transporter substrate-binding domain-containing protein [Desulfocapsaceae bacterium]